MIAELICEPGKRTGSYSTIAVPGLAVRISAAARKTFLAQYTITGEKLRVPIGRWGAVTLKQARLAARGILGDVAKGQDVARTRVAARTLAKTEAAANKVTLAALLEQWNALALAQHRDSYRREAVRAFKAAFPGFLERRADALEPCRCYFRPGGPAEGRQGTHGWPTPVPATPGACGARRWRRTHSWACRSRPEPCPATGS